LKPASLRSISFGFTLLSKKAAERSVIGEGTAVSMKSFDQLRRDWALFGIANRRRSFAALVAVGVLATSAGLIGLLWSPWAPWSPQAGGPGTPGEEFAVVQPVIANTTAGELLRDLEKSTPLVGLEFDESSPTMPGVHVRAANLKRWTKAAFQGRHELSALRPEFADLPMIGEEDCHADPATAAAAAEISLAVRRIQPSFARRTQSTAVSEGLIQLLDANKWERPEAVRSIIQIYQVENDRVRNRLVEYLAKVAAPEADQGLVDRAVFDLSSDVRAAAVKALAARPVAGYREHLLAAFRHPWPAAADHAAEAVVKLAKPELVAELETLSKQPDPSLAVKNEQGQWHRTELVRINHLANCVLCHPPIEARNPTPPTGTPTISLAAAIPMPDQPLPEVYYEQPSSEPLTEIRGDIVYLRQDFSLLHATNAYAPWPAIQRFDYVRRTRTATPEEIERAEAAARSGPTSYPQREAVLAALGRLKPGAAHTAAR